MNPTYPISRKDKKVLSGTLTPRLVNEDDAYGAVASLAKSSKDCTISVQRPTFDYQNGRENDPKKFVIEKDDIEKFDTGVSDLIVKSRDVKILAGFSDGGIILVKPTVREWEYVHESQEARSAILEFGRRLEGGASPSVLTPGWGAFFACWPLSVGIPILMLDSAVALLLNPELRVQYRESEETPTFHYIGEGIMQPLVYTWAPALALFAFIILAHSLSGGLRAWPKRLSAASMHHAIHFFGTKILPHDVKHIRTTILTVIATAFATWLLTG